ncbi:MULTISPECIES: group III truncated hemoglobin [unclassified Phyllobacterium]|uniref:group III truncated hemoglobin n=1 Tax=unclassified Phyllobacterium TaxID=2638441 RepID=UPI003013134F
MSDAERRDTVTEMLVERLVHEFYRRVRDDSLLGPIFEDRLAGRWELHLAKMVDFWSSVAMRTGRYSGNPHSMHQHLGLKPEHFVHWLNLFKKTVDDICTVSAAELFIVRANRIADSLQIGLNIGPNALQLGPRHSAAVARQE